MSLYFIQREPGRLELPVGVQLRLIEVVWRRRIAVLAKDQDRASFNLRAEVDYAYEGMSRNTVAAFLSLFGASVKVEDDAQPPEVGPVA